MANQVIACGLLAAVAAFFTLALWRATREPDGVLRRYFRRSGREGWDRIEVRPASPPKTEVDAPE